MNRYAARLKINEIRNAVRRLKKLYPTFTLLAPAPWAAATTTWSVVVAGETVGSGLSPGEAVDDAAKEKSNR